MRLFQCLAATLAIATLFLSTTAQAGTREVRTDYFTIALPEGWNLPKPPETRPGAVMVTVIKPAKNGGGDSIVSIAVVEKAMTAKDLARQTYERANKRARGRMTPPVEDHGMYRNTYEQNGLKAENWYGSNGRLFAVTTLLGAESRELLKSLKTVDESLFPRF